jgi:ubiquinone biosynthesis protein
VGANLASDESVHAALPAPIPGMCTRRVLAMRFVHGAKINDLDALRRVAGVETAEQRTHLAEDITNAFARQLFVDGIFQADPHPGNILVSAGVGSSG